MSRRCQSLLTTQQTSIHACTNCFLQAYRYRCLGDQIRHIIKQILDSYAVINKLDESIENIKKILDGVMQPTWKTLLNELEIIRSTKYET